MIQGRRVKQSLHTDDRGLAEAAARRLHEQQLAANFSAFQELSGRGWSGARELRAAYLQCPDVRAREASRRRNFGDLDRAVCLVRGGEPLAWDTGALSRDFVPRWKSATLAAARERCAGDGLALEAAKRALNSTLGHWQSIFCAPALAHYRTAGIVLPEHIGELAAAHGVPAERMPEVLPLSNVELAALDAAAPGLRAHDPATWAVYQLMSYGGLRNSECAAATWDWVGRRGEEWFLEIARTAEFKPKGSAGRVGLAPELVAALLDIKRDGDDHLVPADSVTERHDACYRRINAWLAQAGIATSTGGKRAYRLRRQYAYSTEVEHGAEAASRALRHGSSSNVLRHYSPSSAQISAPVRTLRGTDEIQGAAAVAELRRATA